MQPGCTFEALTLLPRQLRQLQSLRSAAHSERAASKKQQNTYECLESLTQEQRQAVRDLISASLADIIMDTRKWLWMDKHARAILLQLRSEIAFLSEWDAEYKEKLKWPTFTIKHPVYLECEVRECYGDTYKHLLALCAHNPESVYQRR